MHWVVIPFRGPEGAKSRLAETMGKTARTQVARAMFQHVLRVACGVVGGKNVLVVTPSDTAAEIARRAGSVVLRETVAGHNEAVSQACAHLRARGATTAAIVAADLPLLRPLDIQVLMRCAGNGIVGIAPDRGGGGTNAIALPLGIRFSFHFGDDSLYRHQRQARQLGVPVRLVHRVGLVCDLDTADDLVLLEDTTALSTQPALGVAAYRGLQ